MAGGGGERQDTGQRKVCIDRIQIRIYRFIYVFTYILTYLSIYDAVSIHISTIIISLWEGKFITGSLKLTLIYLFVDDARVSLRREM